MDNPYLLEALNVIKSYEEKHLKFKYYSEMRVNLLNKYAWGIPTEEVIQEISKYSPLIELGAGTGYWAYLLNQAGCDITAFDSGLWDSIWRQRYYNVEQGDESVLEKYKDRTLFMCWPLRVNKMSEHVYDKYKGKYLIFVGEDRGSDPDAEDYYDKLSKEFKIIKTMNLPRWSGYNDSLFIYERL